MGLFQSSSVILYSIAAVIFTSLIFYLWRRRDVPGALSLLILLPAVTLYLLVEAIVISGVEQPGRLSWQELKSIALVILAAAVIGSILVLVRRARQAEQALRESEERFSAFMDHLPAATFIKDENSTNLYLNRYMQTIKGADDWLGKTPFDAFPPHIAQSIVADDQEAFVGGHCIRIETLPRSPGGERVYQTHKFPLVREGKPTLLGGISIDITEQVQAEQALRRKLEELTALHAVAAACAESTSEDGLIERVTTIIGETLFPDAFGLLLLDEGAGMLYLHPSYRGVPDTCRSAAIPVGECIPGQAAATGLPFRVSHESTVPAFPPVSTPALSQLCVPVKAGGRVMGVIQAQSSRVDVFSEMDERLMVTLAGQLSAALDRLRAEAAGRRRVEELLAITRVNSEINSKLDRQQVFGSIVRYAAKISGCDASGLFLYRPDGRFYLAAAFGVKESFIQQVNAMGVPLQGSAVGRAAQERQPVQVVDAAEDPWYVLRGLAGSEGIRAILALPMLLDEKIIGGVVLWRRAPYRFSQEEILFLHALAQQSLYAVENARLFEAEHQRATHLEALNDIIAAAAAATNLDELLSESLERILHALNVDGASIQMGEKQVAAEIPPELIAEFHAALLDAGPDRAGRYRVEDWQVELERGSSPPLAQAVLTAGFRSSAVFPIQGTSSYSGGIWLFSCQPHTWSVDEIALIEVVAKQIGASAERLRLLEETRSRLLEVSLLSRVITLTASADNLTGAMSQICAEVAQFFGVGQAGFALLNASSTSAEVVAEYRENSRSGEPSGLGIQIPVEGNPSMSYILEHKIPLAVVDAQKDPLLEPIHEVMRQRDVASILLVPILRGGQVVGTLGIDAAQRREFSQRDLNLVRGIASQVGQALERLWLFDESRRRATQQEALNAIIAAAVSASPDLSSLLEATLDLLLKALDLQRGRIWVAGQAVARGMPVVLPYSDLEPGAEGTEACQQEAGCSSSSPVILTVPVVADGRNIGALRLDHERPDAWVAEEVALVEAVGRQLGSAVERLNLLARLQAQARQMEQIMDTVPEGVLLLDADHRIVLANPAAGEHLAVLTGSARSDEPLLHLANFSIEDLLETSPETPWVEIESAGDARRVYEAAARPLHSKEQNNGWVLVLREVTQERETQRRIQMQDRLATVGQLAAGIAHDFNNIMAAIVVYTDLLGMDPNLASSSRERLVIIQQQVQRATSLIRQILDFSRRSIMEQSNLDLLPFVKELDKLLGRVLPENIRLELTYQPGSYQVKADPTRLQQVFMNLALNARDAMPQGGTLRFELERFHIGPSEDPPVPDLCSGSWIKIQVKDSGVGISPEVKPHIFDPFFTTKPVGQGTGLGLAQVYGIIKQHGGSIDVESSSGRGTTFILYLPSLDLPGEPHPESLPVVDQLGKGETILLAEDDRSTREAIQALLESQNYRILTASTGIEALQIYEQCREEVKLVISDVVMPEMGGMALYHRLRDKYGSVKMLFITGHPLDTENQLLLEEGAVSWLQKPFSVQDFLRALQQLLEPGRTGWRTAGTVKKGV